MRSCMKPFFFWLTHFEKVSVHKCTFIPTSTAFKSVSFEIQVRLSPHRWKPRGFSNRRRVGRRLCGCSLCSFKHCPAVCRCCVLLQSERDGDISQQSNLSLNCSRRIENLLQMSYWTSLIGFSFRWDGKLFCPVTTIAPGVALWHWASLSLPWLCRMGLRERACVLGQAAVTAAVAHKDLLLKTILPRPIHSLVFVMFHFTF